MTNEQLKGLQAKLWDSANDLRAYGGIKSSDYAVPVLGLIFLKFADNKYSQFEEQILAEYKQDKGKRKERPIEDIALATCGFYLPLESKFDHLLNLPGDQSMAKALREAMEGIERYQDAKFKDVLPSAAYFDIEKKKKDILPQLLRSFSDIPKDASGDVFGKIYEYFLGKFALSEGQKGGEFFTPTSVVRFIVEVIEPYHGKIFDPACGSGGMFVQSATFIRNANHDVSDIYVCGQEFMGETVRLAKMNMLVNNLRGEVFETNSYASNPHDSYGKFDFVMANPPFNVSAVLESTVKDDKRFYEYGLPKNKGKQEDKIPNANYLWISLFATSLNEKGRAGFVMANSASDGSHTEYEIRKKIVDSGIVDVMVSMPSNMFFTVTLPATLWFFDKAKAHTDRKDKILFLDARNVYQQIDRAHREWTEEQQQNLAAIVRLYRGETNRFLELVNRYILEADKALQELKPWKEALEKQIASVHSNLVAYMEATKAVKGTPAKMKALTDASFHEKLGAISRTKAKVNEVVLQKLPYPLSATPLKNEAQHRTGGHIEWHIRQNEFNADALKEDIARMIELWKLADDNAKVKNDKTWTENDLSKADKKLEEALQGYQQAIANAGYWQANIAWLQKRFPDAKYKDVVSLCKVADREEYVDEQDYSLNAGRYVGVFIEEEDISEQEFKARIEAHFAKFTELNGDAKIIEESISNNIKSLLNA